MGQVGKPALPVELKYLTCPSEGKDLLPNSLPGVWVRSRRTSERLKTPGNLCISEWYPLGLLRTPLVGLAGGRGATWTKLPVPVFMDPQPLDDDLCSAPGTATGTPPPKKGPLFATLDPYAPASAPSNSSSGATEAQAKIPTKKQRRRNSYKPAPKQVLEDLFSIRNESWTRFFAVSEPGILDNIEIFNDLKSKLPDEFECFRRNDGSILIDAKTQRNAEIIERLEHIATNEVKTSRDQLLNSRSGTILVPLSEFRDDENIERKL